MKEPLKKKNENVTREFEEVLRSEPENYVLRLYVTGMTPRSAEALANVRAVCEKHLHGRYELEVIDLYQRPALAKDEQIVAAPTLIKQLPSPLRRLVGNLAQEERLLIGLDLRLKGDR